MARQKINDRIAIRVTLQDRKLAERVMAKLEPTLGKQNFADLFRMGIRALAAKEGVGVQ